MVDLRVEGKRGDEGEIGVGCVGGVVEVEEDFEGGCGDSGFDSFLMVRKLI